MKGIESADGGSFDFAIDMEGFYWHASEVSQQERWSMDLRCPRCEAKVVIGTYSDRFSHLLRSQCPGGDDVAEADGARPPISVQYGVDHVTANGVKVFLLATAVVISLPILLFAGAVIAESVKGMKRR